MKHVFIINPNSGRNKKNNIEKRIVKACKELKLEYEICITTAPGDAKRITKSLENENACVVCAVGGDGTVNEIVNGIVGSQHMLSVIPSGSGNDFFRTIKGNKKEYISCDVGKINDRCFINIACIGIDADIAENVSLMRRIPIIPVSQRYNASIIYTFFKYRFHNLQLKFGELTKKGRFTIVTVCNAKYYGSGYKIAPHALLDDGQFEIYVVERMPKIKIPGLLLKLKKAKHEEDDRVRRYSDSAVEICSDKLVACNVDGETMKSDNFKIEIIKNAVVVYKNSELLEALGIK